MTYNTFQENPTESKRIIPPSKFKTKHDTNKRDFWKTLKLSRDALTKSIFKKDLRLFEKSRTNFTGFVSKIEK